MARVRDGGQGHEGQFGFQRSPQVQRFSRPEPVDENDRGPAKTDKQADGAGYVGGHPVCFLGCHPGDGVEGGSGIPGQDRLYDVFGQDGEQGQDGNCQGGGDVQFCNLGGPREEERPGQDAHP